MNQFPSRSAILNSPDFHPDLQCRIENCGMTCMWPHGQWGYYRCGALACPACRRRARRTHLGEGMKLFCGRPAGTRHVIEVPFPHMPKNALKGAIERLRMDFRNRKGRPAALRAHFWGLLDITHTDSDRWHITARLLVDIGGANSASIYRLIGRKWPTARMRQAENLVSEVQGLWPSLGGDPSLLNWLYENQNMRALRLHCRPARQNRPAPRSGRGWADEPMPVIF